ncbi:sensor histidine kinase [Actinoplanes sp. NPDC049668]|uniref:sensor histidine kinase n=1 Tax=unclassified Actinoplanes TaxID=2626549 RepID=UPI0033AD54D9
MAVDAPPLRWMASLLYGAVLLTGLYFVVAGLAPDASAASVAGFVAALLALLVVEQLDWRAPTTRRRAIVLLAVRMLLLAAVNTADPGGFARVLYVLPPFVAYLSLGREAGHLVAVAYLTGAVVQAVSIPGWHSDPEIVSDLLMFFVGMVLALAAAAFAADQRRSRLRAERLVDDLRLAQRRVAELGAAAERNRLARDIHDSLGHHLTAISVQLAKAEAFRDRDPAAADRAVADAHRAAGRALREIRESVGVLRAEPFLLAVALGALAEGLDDAGFRVRLEVSGSESAHDRAGLEALYRVAQEALTNARRHAAADRVEVVLRCGDADAVLEVEDNGRGFAVEAATGTGLPGMRERLAALGGSVRVESAPGRGTRVVACLPGPAVAR